MDIVELMLGLNMHRREETGLNFCTIDGLDVSIALMYPSYSTRRYARITTYKPYYSYETNHFTYSDHTRLFLDIKRVLGEIGILETLQMDREKTLSLESRFADLDLTAVKDDRNKFYSSDKTLFVQVLHSSTAEGSIYLNITDTVTSGVKQTGRYASTHDEGVYEDLVNCLSALGYPPALAITRPRKLRLLIGE